MTGEIWKSSDGAIELRCGRWQDVLADVDRCDVICSDPPFSDRIHAGQRTGSSTRKTTLIYDGMTEDAAHELAEAWAPRTNHWALIFCDHMAARWHEAAWLAVGWYVFAPVIWLRKCPTPRLAGDGPTSACDYLIVARPKRRLSPGRAGHRRGYYISPHTNGGGFTKESTHPGSKMLEPMKTLIRDYTLHGDLVADPYAGSATTPLAAAIEGRRCIGAECDPATWKKAVHRLEGGWTPDLFGDAR